MFSARHHTQAEIWLKRPLKSQINFSQNSANYGLTNVGYAKIKISLDNQAVIVKTNWCGGFYIWTNGKVFLPHLFFPCCWQNDQHVTPVFRKVSKCQYFFFLTQWLMEQNLSKASFQDTSYHDFTYAKNYPEGISNRRIFFFIPSTPLTVHKNAVFIMFI